MTRKEEFARVFQMPPAMLPYVDLVADDREMELVLKLHEQPMTAAEVADAMAMPLADAESFLRRSYVRYIVDRQASPELITYVPASFNERLDPLSMYEGWGDVPAQVRDAVIQWQLQEFIDKWQPAVQQILKDPDVYVRIPNRDVLLLDEALEMVAAASEHAVLPCDCRAISMVCGRPREACIRLDGAAARTLERGMGRPLTKDACAQLIVDLDRKGLMHTGPREWRQADELFGLCNCCACDCYPIRAGVSLGMEKQWPRSHYVAERDASRCRECGLCARRCHFGAFHIDGATDPSRASKRQHVTFDPEKCWGCGLCATACPESAIAMRSLHS